MDYLLRDSLMTGAKYGVYDLEWIIKSLEIDEENDRLYVSAPGIYAVEDYLQARYYMFRQVYFHRTLRAAENVLRALVRRALHLFQSGGDVWFAVGTAFEKIVRNEKLNLREHLELDDTDINFHIKQWQKSDDKILSDLAGRFLNRRLFKAFDLDMRETDKEAFLKKAEKIVENAGFDPEYYFIEDKSAGDAYHFYTKNTDEPKNFIYVEEGFSRPTIREISEVSAAVRGLQKGWRMHRICFPAELKNRIAKFIIQNENAAQCKLNELPRPAIFRSAILRSVCLGTLIFFVGLNTAAQKIAVFAPDKMQSNKNSPTVWRKICA